jgi:hypothetical protein
MANTLAVAGNWLLDRRAFLRGLHSALAAEDVAVQTEQLQPCGLGVDAESCHAARDDPWYKRAAVNNRESPKMSKKTVTKAKARLKKAKINLAALQRRVRKEAARMAAALKRHHSALKAATRSYKKARMSA